MPWMLQQLHQFLQTAELLRHLKAVLISIFSFAIQHISRPTAKQLLVLFSARCMKHMSTKYRHFLINPLYSISSLMIQMLSMVTGCLISQSRSYQERFSIGKTSIQDILACPHKLILISCFQSLKLFAMDSGTEFKHSVLIHATLCGLFINLSP